MALNNKGGMGVVNAASDNTKAIRGVYYNIYRQRGDYTELCIHNNCGINLRFKVDNEIVCKLRQNKWSVTFVGKIGHKSPRVYCYINGEKVCLNRYITNIQRPNKIIFKNRDQYDYRQCNLVAAGKNELENRNKNAIGQEGMNNIALRFNSIGNVRAYVVRYKSDDGVHTKTFSVSKFSSNAEALLEAQKFRDSNFVTKQCACY